MKDDDRDNQDYYAGYSLDPDGVGIWFLLMLIAVAAAALLIGGAV